MADLGDEMLLAIEEDEIAIEKTLVKPKQPLPIIPLEPGQQPATAATQPARQPAVPWQMKSLIPGQEFLYRISPPLVRQHIFDPIYRAADWASELLTSREETEAARAAGVDVYQEGLPDPVAESVRDMQSNIASWAQMQDLDPEFTKNAAGGMLAAIFNQYYQPEPSIPLEEGEVPPTSEQRRWTPKDFNVRSLEGRLVFDNPVTDDTTPIDSYALTSEDLGQNLSQVKPFVSELAGALAGVVAGTGGTFLLTRNLGLATRVGQISGVIGESLAAIQVQYDARVDAAINQGLRPVLWLMPEDNPEDKSIPKEGRKEEEDDTGRASLRWVFWKKGLDGEGSWDAVSRKTYSDSEMFTKGAAGKALYAAGGAVGASLLYRLYRWTKGSRVGNKLGDIISAEDFEKALRSQGIKIDSGEIMNVEGNTPQVLLRYADSLASESSILEAAGDVAKAKVTRKEEEKFRIAASRAAAQLQAVGGGDMAKEATQAAVRNVVEEATGQPVSQVQVLGRIGDEPTAKDVADDALLARGRQVMRFMRERSAKRAQVALSTLQGNVRKLQQSTIAAGIGLGRFPGEAYSKLSETLKNTKDLLFQGDQSYFTKQIYGPLNKQLNALVPLRSNIAIDAPEQLREIRRQVAKRADTAPLPFIDNFIKGVAQVINLPKPTVRGVTVYGLGPTTTVNTTLDVVNRKIKELRSNIMPELSPGVQMRAAKQMEAALINLRKGLVQGSDQYRNATPGEQKIIRKAVGDFTLADNLYSQAKQLYSEGRVGEALAKLETNLPYKEQGEAFFRALVPPNSSLEEVAQLLSSLGDPKIGVRTLENINTKNLLVSGLYDTWARRVTRKGGEIGEIIAGQGKITDIFDLAAHKEFIQQYGPVLRSILPERIGDRTRDDIYQELINDPAKLLKMAQNDLMKYRELKKAMDTDADLIRLGMTDLNPGTALDDILTNSPESYPRLREFIQESTLSPAAKEELLKDMDDGVRSLFIRKISEDSPSVGVKISGKAMMNIFVSPRMGSEVSEDKFGDALKAVFSKIEINRLTKIGRDLRLLEEQAETAAVRGWPMLFPDLKGDVLDSRKALGALARVYVGVLNTRARMLTATQRVLGTKAGDVLLDALVNPEVAKKLIEQSIPKPGMFKKSLIRLIGATTGVYLSMDEAEEVENIAKISPEDIEVESMFDPSTKPKEDRPIDFEAMKRKIAMPGFNLPALPSKVDIPIIGEVPIPRSLRLQKPGTLTVPPVVEEGIGALQRSGVNWLRKVEQDKLYPKTGLPLGAPFTPFNSGGIVQAVPRRARQRVL
jgi:hypothetical protein